MQTEQEKLSSPEISAVTEQLPATAEGSLTAEAVTSLYQTRQADLETMKKWVGLKFYYRAVEKIKQEEQALRRLLRLEDAKQSILADYSFVLDPAYFEQKFLNL